jgi:hypothetical protein
MRRAAGADIMKYVYRSNFLSSVSDILLAVMPRAVVTKLPGWELGGR